jgi:hypothetical protein
MRCHRRQGGFVNVHNENVRIGKRRCDPLRNQQVEQASLHGANKMQRAVIDPNQ